MGGGESRQAIGPCGRAAAEEQAGVRTMLQAEETCSHRAMMVQKAIELATIGWGLGRAGSSDEWGLDRDGRKTGFLCRWWQRTEVRLAGVVCVKTGIAGGFGQGGSTRGPE